MAMSIRCLSAVAILLLATGQGLQADDVGGAVLAWQRTDKYVAPDFVGYFPDEEAAGRELDELYIGKIGQDFTPEQRFDLVRRGLRRMTNHPTLLLAEIGKKYIWNVSPQHPLAIELMYHASAAPDRANIGHYAMYFGLTVVSDRGDNLMRMLMSQYWRWDRQTRERILWGFNEYGNKADTAARLARLLEGTPPLAEDATVAAYEAYERVTGEKPPHAERFEKLGLFVVGFTHRDEKTQADLAGRLEADLEWKPGDTLAAFTSRHDGKQRVGVALVRGMATRDRLVERLKRGDGYTLESAQLLTPGLLGERRLSEFATFLKEPAPPGVPRHDEAYEPADGVYAWNRTDHYAPPDFSGFFADDEQAGKELDALFATRDHLTLSDKEILSLVRRGLRRATIHPNGFCSWFASSFLFTWPCDPAAVEIIYHASGAPARDGVKEYRDLKYSAVYYALSGLRDKPENLLRTFASLYGDASRDMRQRLLGSLIQEREKKFVADLLSASLDRQEPLPVEQVVAVVDGYRQLIGIDPPRPERYENVGLFVVAFRHGRQGTLAQLNQYAQQELAGADYWVDFTTMDDGKGIGNSPKGLALVRGLAGRNQLVAKLRQDKSCMIDLAHLLTPEMAKSPALVSFARHLEAADK